MIKKVLFFTTPKEDARIGKHARTLDGQTDGRIISICHYPEDGFETICIGYGSQGMSHGGLLPAEITILDVPDMPLYQRVAFRLDKDAPSYEWYGPPIHFPLGDVFHDTFIAYQRLEWRCECAIYDYGIENVIIVEATSEESYEKVNMREIGSTSCPQSPPLSPK